MIHLLACRHVRRVTGLGHGEQALPSWWQVRALQGKARGRTQGTITRCSTGFAALEAIGTHEQDSLPCW